MRWYELPKALRTLNCSVQEQIACYSDDVPVKHNIKIRR
jgi:hypothetical protein